MNSDVQPGANELAVITVSFNPNLEQLERQFRAIPDEALLIIVDNASSSGSVKKLEKLVSHRKNSMLICNAENEGLAAAINRGARSAKEPPPFIEYLLLMDQDSIPAAGAIKSLLDAYHKLKTTHPNLGCVGPLLTDATTGLSHGFHKIQGWRWTRAYPKSGEPSPVPCANLNGSGTLVSCKLFERLGGLDETFFIDHIDTDWAFRVLASGHELWGIPWVQFEHTMGEKSLRFWLFGWRIWPYRTPKRHYFLFRNAVRLMRKSYTPAIWKGWAFLKLLLTLGLHLIADVQRWEQAKSMLAGVKAGLTEIRTAK